MIDTSGQPFISVLLPVGDDIGTIVRALGSALDQDYPRDQMEVIMVDRGSHDGTHAVAMRATYDKRARLIDLPGATPAAALTLALRSARGEVVVLLDGRTLAPPGYLAACVAALQRGAADLAVGQVQITGESNWGWASALATSYATSPQPLACRKALGDRLGGWPAQPPPNAALAYLPADMLATRPGPPSFVALWQHHLGRGRAAASVLRASSDPIGPQQLGPLALVALAAGTLLATAIRPLRPLVGRLWRWYLFVLALLTLYSANSPVQTTRGRGSASPPQPAELLPYLPLAHATVHLAYGCGLLLGLIRPES